MAVVNHNHGSPANLAEGCGKPHRTALGVSARTKNL
jgi:hypothetical protein